MQIEIREELQPPTRINRLVEIGLDEGFTFVGSLLSGKRVKTDSIERAKSVSLPISKVFLSGSANAQEVRYSWLDLSVMVQDVELQGTLQTPIAGQSVDVETQDGDGVLFRASFGTWKNLYLFGEFGSSDIDVALVVNNDQGSFPDEDEFDLTTIRGGVGVKYSIAFSTDLYAEISADSVDLDFGSFAGEDFDVDEQDIGGTIGVRHMLNDKVEIRAYGRYSNLSFVNLSTKEFDAGEYFGAGFSWEIVRGLALVGDYETGDFETWSIGFRLDMDED